MNYEPNDFMSADRGGIWGTLLSISSWIAKERGSKSIDLRDFVIAIYIVDLEHTARYWDDWENFEKFVIQARRSDHRSSAYLNRTLYLFETQLAARENPGLAIASLEVTEALREAIVRARTFAKNRGGGNRSATSCDFLLSICMQEPSLCIDLKRYGLQVDRLEAVVKREEHEP